MPCDKVSRGVRSSQELPLKIEYTVNLEILAAKIFKVSRIVDILANINFSYLANHG